jgi:phosphoribosylanthranilate isomerase
VSFVIKICGLTRPEDAVLACREGATALGLNFWPGSKRFVDDARAAQILAAVAPGVIKVGVFVNATPAEVETRLALGLDWVQLHGDEQPGDFSHLPPERLVRALRVRDRSSLVEADGWRARYFLYDAAAADYGGSGQLAPWEVLGDARRPFLLAGGLGPANVAAAIAATRPDGVDVASGVESSPGVKDAAKLAAFISAAARAARLTPSAGSTGRGPRAAP